MYHHSGKKASWACGFIMLDNVLWKSLKLVVSWPSYPIRWPSVVFLYSAALIIDYWCFLKPALTHYMWERSGTGGDICPARSDQTRLGQLATAEGEVHHLSPQVTRRSLGMLLNKRPILQAKEESLNCCIGRTFWQSLDSTIKMLLFSQHEVFLCIFLCLKLTNLYTFWFKIVESDIESLAFISESL